MKIRLFFYIFIGLLSFLLTFTISGQQTPDKQTAKILDEYLTRMSAFGYSGAVIIEKNGRIILQKGYGFANKEKQIPFTVNTPSSVASISKQFTASVILKLAEQGKLNLNDSITKFIKDVPEDKKAITIKHLLTHTAGFGDTYAASNITDRNEAIRAILKQPLVNPAGSKYLYSNDGYDLAGAIAEIVSGEDLRKFIRRNFFAPLGMKNAGFIGEKDFYKNGQAAHSYNYYTDNGSAEIDTADWEGRGSADVIISAADLYKWELSLRRNRILSAAVKQQMFSPSSTLSNGWHYGYGWFIIKTDRNTTEYYHGGSNVPRGFTASYSRYPDEKTTIIIFVNTMIDEVGFLRAVKDGIVNITFGKTVEMPPSFADIDFSKLKKYTGIYLTDSGDKFTLQLLNNDLLLGAIGQEAINFLTVPEREIKEKLNNFNKITSSLIEKTAPDPQGFPDLKVAFDSFKQHNGNYQGFEILGTSPVSIKYDVLTSFIKMKYEKGDEIIRLVRAGTAVYPLRGNFSPATTPVKPQADSTFVAYYPLLQKTIFLEFEIDKNNQIRDLRLKNESQTIVTKKLK